MKICLLSTNNTPKDDRIYYKLGRSLSKFAEVYILDPCIPRDLDKNPYLIGIDKRLGIRASNRWLYKQLCRILPDFVQVTEPLLLPSAIRYKKEYRVSIIYDPAEDWPALFHDFSHNPWPVPNMLSQWIRRIENKNLRDIDHIIASDDWLFKKYDMLNCPVTLIYNFPNRDLFKTQNKDADRNPNALVYHGQIRKERGLFEMIHAIDILRNDYPGIQLDLIGSFSYPREYRKTRLLINQLGLKDVIQVLSPVPHTEIPALLHKKGIGLLPFQNIPKFQRNIATKMFEYMAGKLPVIATDLKPARQFLEQVKCGILVKPNSVKALADGLRFILDNPGEAGRLGKNGYRAFESRYFWERQETKLIEIFTNHGLH